MEGFRSTFRAGAAALGWFALILQFVLIQRADSPYGVLARSVNFFSYFTILSNIMVAVALTPRAGFLLRPAVRAAILLYIFVVALVYHIVLARLWAPQGGQYVADQLLHTAMPLIFALDWWLFVPKNKLGVRVLPRWLILPLLYGGWTQIHGAISGFYPYPFLNAAALGYPRVVLNLAIIMGVFVGLGFCLVLLDRAIGGPERPERPEWTA